MRSDAAELAVTPLDAGVRDQAEEVARLYPLVYRMFHISHHALPGTDVTPRMLGVLQHLAAAGPLTLSELVLHLSLSKAATTELVDRLEHKGLVARMHDERDRRRVFIWLTDSGRERAGEHPRVLEDELLLAALARMAPDDRQALINGMRALVAARKDLSL
jgi:DNA-binding MarR family transcriptional regulator